MKNPPAPANAQPWNRPITPDMTRWAIGIARDAAAYPMFSVTERFFGGSWVAARVEWQDRGYANGNRVAGVFRSVALYEVAHAVGATAEGIDVSHRQGDVDWTKVASSGKSFAFIKATDGSSLIDSGFERNWSQARDVGLLRGAYHSFRPRQDPRAQGKHFLSRLGTTGELPLAIDLNASDGLAPNDVAQGIADCVSCIRANGARPLIYVSTRLWSTLPSIGIEDEADLIIADWEPRRPQNLGAWSGWTFWQYASSASVPGIAASVDLARFNGTLDELHAALTRVPCDQPELATGADPLVSN